ncbi:MAG: FHA domain-containing protein, partial [Actinomycetota bacterium]
MTSLRRFLGGITPTRPGHPQSRSLSLLVGKGAITTSYLEVWGPRGRELRPLEGDRVTVGTDDSCSLVLVKYGLSRVHAAFERYGDAWSIRDLGSRNGTFVNGERILAERALHAGDEVVLGKLRIVFSSPAGSSSPTGALDPPPPLTQREREVLVALCRPLLGADAFTEPSSIRAMAQELFVTEAAVKQH